MIKPILSKIITLWLCSCPLLSAVASTNIPDGQTRHAIELKAQPLATALIQLAEQTGAQVLFSPEVTADIEIAPLRGLYSLPQVLEVLLAQTGLEFAVGHDGIIAIRRKSMVQMTRQTAAELLTIEEVVITENKLDGVLGRLPLSISALSGVEMELEQIIALPDLSGFVPNLQLRANAPSSGHSASSTMFIRGIGQSEFIPSSDPGVGLYIDGIYYARSVGSALDIVDIDSIEVLRGPQGTLFGRNTIGGAILVHSKPPEPLPGLKLKTTLENDHGIGASLTLNGPLHTDLNARLTLAKHRRNGYVSNRPSDTETGDDNRFFTRLGLRWEPSSHFMIAATLDYLKEDENGPAQVFAAVNTQESLPIIASMEAGCPGVSEFGGVPENQDRRCANNQYQSQAPYHRSANAESASEIESGGAVITMDWKGRWGNMRSVTGYREMSWFSARDADNTPLTILHTINDEQQSQFTQEFNLRGNTDNDRWRWLAGAYFFDETAIEDYPVIFPSTVGSGNTAVDIDNRGHAFFGQLHYQLTDRLSLMVGARKTYETKTARPFIGADEEGPGWDRPNPLSENPSCEAEATAEQCIRLAPGELLYQPQRNSKDFSNFTHATSLSYRPNTQMMVYLSHATGYKSGGFNTRINQPIVTPQSPTGREFLPAYEPEQARTWELGIKSMHFSHQLSVNASLFYTRYEDMQVLTRNDTAPILTNAGEAEIKGLELEWRYNLTEDLQFSGGLGLIDADYRRLSLELLEADQLSGGHGTLGLDNQLVHTPRTNLHIGLTSAFRRDWGVLTPHLGYTYQSKTHFDAANTPQIAQPGYGIFNASVLWATASNHFVFSMALRNITDKRYRLTGNSSFFDPSGYAESTWSRGREWSVSAEYYY